jgi:hypothetical protein
MDKGLFRGLTTLREPCGNARSGPREKNAHPAVLLLMLLAGVDVVHLGFLDHAAAVNVDLDK